MYNNTVSPLYLQALHPWILPTTDQKCLEKRCYIGADVYYPVRTMIGSALNIGRLFFFSCYCSLNDTVQ